MPKYARMIGEGMAKRGYAVEYWTAPCWFSRLCKRTGSLRKWLGYLDAYVVFPPLLRFRSRRLPSGTLIVVADQALGMWVSAIVSLPHVIHCHDFLAQRAAAGEIGENKTGATGRIYQKLIRRGYQKSRHFISISHKTREDLARFLSHPPRLSEVVYNGLNYPFKPLPVAEAAGSLQRFSGVPWTNGFFLHVGGNDWYKNRTGLVKIYHQYLKVVRTGLPLVMVGSKPSQELAGLADEIPDNGRIHFVTGLTDAELHSAYAVATALVFPSLEEGFGWPIIEAQASGCPVITTGLPPMSEVGGRAAWYLPRRNPQAAADEAWAREGADLLRKISTLSVEERNCLVAAGVANASRFALDSALDQMERIYQRIIRLD